MERNGIKMKLSRVGGVHVLFLKNEMINYLEYGKEVFFFLLLLLLLLGTAAFQRPSRMNNTKVMYLRGRHNFISSELLTFVP